MRDCVFCGIVAGTEPAEILARTRTATVFVPLNPVTPGHVLVVPNRHVADAAEKPSVTAGVYLHAAMWGREHGDPFNLITSAGADASQTVYHLHVHYVPRSAGDGLMLP